MSNKLRGTLVLALIACTPKTNGDKPSTGREKEVELCAEKQFERAPETHWVNRVSGANRIEGCFDSDGDPSSKDQSIGLELSCRYDKDGRSVVQRYTTKGLAGFVRVYLPDGRRFESNRDEDHRMTGPWVERGADGSIRHVVCYQAATILLSPFDPVPDPDYESSAMKITKDCGTDASCQCPPWTATPKGAANAAPVASAPNAKAERKSFKACLDGCKAKGDTAEDATMVKGCVTRCGVDNLDCVASCRTEHGGTRSDRCAGACATQYPAAAGL